jgi:O-antigen ligase
MEFNHIISLILIPLGILALFRPFLLLYLFAALPILPFIPTLSQKGGELFKIIQLGNINIFAHDYLIVIMAFTLLYHLLININISRKFLTSPISIVIIALFFWNIFIGILSYSKGFEFQNVLRQLSTEFLVFIALLIPQIEDIDIKKEKFFKFSIVLGLTLVAFGLIRYSITHEVMFTSSGTLRSLDGNSVLILLIPICYIFFYSNYWRNNKIISYFIITLMTIGIILSGHRSGMIVLLFIFAAYYLSNQFNKLKYLWIPLWGIALVSIITIVINNVDKTLPDESFLGDLVIRANETFNLENETTKERLDKWKLSVEVFKEKPLLGLGRYSVYTQHIDEENPNLESFEELNRAVHNLFFNKLIHEGLIGFSIIILFLYVILKQFKKISAFDQQYAGFLKIYILSFILYSMFNTPFADFEKIFFFIFVGFLNAEILKDPLLSSKYSQNSAPTRLSVTNS